jgi:pimeloyl-ACP methyl ester carboxylesterase
MLSLTLIIALLLEAIVLAALAVALFRAGLHALLAMAAALALGVLWRAAIVCGSFWLSGAARARPRMQALKSMFAEGWSMLYLYTLAMPLALLTTRRSKSFDAPVVIFLHGFLCNAGMWGAMRRALDQAQLMPHAAINVDPLFRSMTSCLASATSRIQQILQQQRAQHCVLIGHSMGGVLARMLAVRAELPIHAIVTIGAPHAGTTLARWVSSIHAGPARIDSAWLHAFQLELSKAKPIRQLNLWSDGDNIVAPQDSARLTLDCAQVYGLDQPLKGLGHLQMVRSKDVIARVIDFLRTQCLVVKADNEVAQHV